MKAIDQMFMDNGAMVQIHELLDGKEHNSDTLAQIVEIVANTGREVRDVDDIDACEY